MRLVDVLHPSLATISTVIDTTTGQIDLEPYLHLPAGVEFRRDSGDRPLTRGEMALAIYGPDPRLHGDLSEFRRLLNRVELGAQILLAFGYRSAELPYHELLDSLVMHRCQVLWVASLSYDNLHGAAVIACTDELLPLRDWFGRPVAPDPATGLRLADEYVLADFVSRCQRARMMDLEQLAADAELAETAAATRTTESVAQLVDQRDAAARSLRRARERVALLEARVAMLEGSTSMRVGKALVSAARSPARAPLQLPRELGRIWRGRSRTASAASNGSKDEPDRSALGLPLIRRALAMAPQDRLVLAGLFNTRTANDIEVDAVVNRLLPHTGRIVVERTLPDAVVVQLSACIEDGAWALTGTGGAPDLDRRLNELLTAARESGVPSILWRDVPAAAAPGLARFSWDGVLDADAGQQPTRLDPRRYSRAALRELITTQATRVRLSQLARIIGAPDPLDARRVSVVASPDDPALTSSLIEQVLAQIHRPVEVITAKPDRAFDEVRASGIAVHDGEPTAPWVADWSRSTTSRPATHLLDLICAVECTGADAAGFPVDEELAAQQAQTGIPETATFDFRFEPAIEPGLVGRSLFLLGGVPDTWARRRHRLVAIRTGEPS